MIAQQEASVLLDSILSLQGEGLSSSEVSRRLGIELRMVRSLARNAKSPFGSLQAYKRAKLAPPASAELLAALTALPRNRCMYIAQDLHDPEARPCGAPCCIATVDGHERRSSWCAEHHLIVYPVISRDTMRKISTMSGVKDLARSYAGGHVKGGWRRS